MSCTTEEITHEAQGEEFIENPDYVAATEGYYETVENPDYVPAVPEHEVFIGVMKWNWTGGPINYTPAPPGGTDDWGWHQVGITQDSKGSEPGVVHKGKGKASYFYYESVYEVVPEVPAVGEPTKEVWVDGTPAVGVEFIPNPEYVPAWTEQVETCTPPIITCPEGKVPGWLDEFGNAQGCVDNNPTPPVKPEEPVITPEEPVTTPEEETLPIPEAPTENATETIQAVTTTEAPELAVTGGVDGLSAALFGVVLLIAGVGLMMKRKEA